jgi:hypothetical protein
MRHTTDVDEPQHVADLVDEGVFQWDTRRDPIQLDVGLDDGSPPCPVGIGGGHTSDTNREGRLMTTAHVVAPGPGAIAHQIRPVLCC